MDMVMTWIWLIFLGISVLAALITGNGSALAAAIPQGAQSGVQLAISLAGSICLWTGVGAVMEKAGVTRFLSRLFMPVLSRIFPSCKKDPAFARNLSANVCANFLGLGNAATPMGIRAAQCLARQNSADELCRLIVLNTASIQLLPTTVASVRAACSSAAPFDILPAVWITSLCSAGLGGTAAWLLGKVWRK